MQTLDTIDDLLRVLVRRDLAMQHIHGSDNSLRVILTLPTCEDYLSVALDEIISIGADAILVGRRLHRLLQELLAHAPTEHRAPIEARLAAVTRRLPL